MSILMQKRILDPCCGGRMMWFDRQHPEVIFGDRRSETWSPLELEGQDRIMSRSTFDPSIHVPTRRPVG